MSLGELIRKARTSKKIRQHAVADELGVTVQAVSQWERDKTVPSQLNLMRLAKLLDVDIEGIDVIGRIPMLTKPANYAPLLGAFPTIFYGHDRSNESVLNELGDFVDFETHKTELIPVNWDAVGNIFAMRVDDKSMAPAFLPEDIVIVDTGISAQPGDYVVGHAYPSNGGILRRLRMKGKDPEGHEIADLVPLNGDYPTVTIAIGKTGEITGCVREFRRVLRQK